VRTWDVNPSLTPVGVLSISEEIMTAKRIALALVVLAAATIVAAKTAKRRGDASSTGSASAALVGRPAVVLVADTREADSDFGPLRAALTTSSCPRSYPRSRHGN
jgi:hypothetical protein